MARLQQMAQGLDRPQRVRRRADESLNELVPEFRL